ncbi:MAG: histidinol dehydrogenase [Angelakisella sp.]|nr:histidinol dehydrogenase [Angelakisella sp.]
MIRLFEFDTLRPDEILNRDLRAEKNVEQAVEAIIADVRARGDEALRDYARRFDGAVVENLLVSEEEIDEALKNTDPYFWETLCMAAANIEAFHRKQLHNDFVMDGAEGVVLGQKYTPIEKAGVYVPGGTAAYPSTVLMDVIPAKVAGVSDIIMTTPPGKDGKINPVILAAASVAGVTKIVKAGGAQAIAALAYGTQSVPAVDKIVGPGNVYVATAKRMVFGKVGIDMIAGPSEILVLADGGCNPAWVAADLLSQAEHDALASAVLVTDSVELAKAVQAELEVQIPKLSRADIARKSIDDNGKIILCDDLNKAVEACNIIAPEHLELCVEDPFGLLPQIKNAGSIFLGRHVPEALGDYCAGPNHTLPTSGTARFSSPLGVDDFVKKSSFLYYTPKALAEVAERVTDFALREGLDAHAKSVAIRGQKD